MHFQRLFYPIFFASIVIAATLSVHDDNFVPDAILRVSKGERKQSCVPAKEILLVNGTSPGPELRFREGETVWIRVYNDMKEHNLTMHWHGLTMAAAPFSDGTPAASQWPIPPAHYFDYELNVPLKMAGTFFYHSHIGVQAISCTGPLIIVDADQPPYYYDGERIVFLQEVFPDTDEDIEAALLATPMAYEKNQAMVLINGRGAGLDGYGVACNDTLSVLNVEPGKTYRLRIIAGTGISTTTFAIEGHNNLEVIEADGAYTDRHSTPFIQSGPGQRFSALLHTLEKPTKKQYYLQLETREFGNLTRSYAVINYGPPAPSRYGSPSPPSNSSSIVFYPPKLPKINLPPMDYCFLEYQLRPLHSTINPSDMPTAAEVTRRVNITVHLSIPDGRLVYYLNGYTWNEEVPVEPYLVSLYKNDSVQFPSMERALANEGLDPITRAFPAQIGEVIEIVIQGTGSDGGEMESHPWHAHGAHFWDLGGGDGFYNVEANEAKWASSPGKPIKRDTTMLYRYHKFEEPGKLSGWRAWRLRITQPGVWMVHCHILPHMVWGMQTVWVMGNSTEVLGADIPDVEGYLTYGGSVVGNATHDPVVVDYFGAWADSQ